MEDRDGHLVCTRGFPKALAGATSIGERSFPNYRSRGCERGWVVDDCWVMPFSPYLLTKFDGHINVEVCATILFFKYLHMFIYKRHNRALVKIRRPTENGLTVTQSNHEEITSYVNSRYVSE